MRKATTSPSFARASGTVTALAALGLLLTGCGGGESSSSANPAVQTVNSPAQIARESAENYHDNVNGLITGQTLMRWIDDWPNNRPDGINGRLVIMQVTRGTEGKEYITPKPGQGVRTYHIDTDRLTQVRSNGVLETRQMVPEGALVDGILKDYNLDPRNDMIVWVVADASNFGALMRQGRGWYMMRYWGTPHENLAVLNGRAVHDAVMDQSYLGSVATCDEPRIDPDEDFPDCLPRNGTVTVGDLPEDNISLQATLQDVLDAAEGRSDAFVWDARSEGEYMGTAFSSGAMQGHPRGAVVLPYGNLIMDDGSYRYKDKASLERYMNGEQVDGAMFQRYEAGSLIPVGPGNAYEAGQASITYCETTFRAMITGFATAAILGLPNRFYDGAMTEWNQLASGIQNSAGDFPLPADSPWALDRQNRSHFVYRDPADIPPHDIHSPYADNTNAIVNADRNYRMGNGGGTGGGTGGDDGGLAPPSNACGG